MTVTLPKVFGWRSASSGEPKNKWRWR